MTEAEYQRAKKPANVSKLLDRVENHLEKDYRTAYNFLIEYSTSPSGSRVSRAAGCCC